MHIVKRSLGVVKRMALVWNFPEHYRMNFYRD